MRKLLPALAPVIVLALALFATPVAQAAPFTVDLEDDPYVGNVTCNAALTAYECFPAHHAWLIAKGVDIVGTPQGFLWRTVMGGEAGRTGNIVGFAAPHYGDSHGGVGIGETLTITLVKPAPAANLASTAGVVLTIVPSLINNNLPSTVTLTALDAGGNPLAATTSTFVGVTNGVLTPHTLSVAATGTQIRSVRLTTTQHATGGVFLEAVTFDVPDNTLPTLALAFAPNGQAGWFTVSPAPGTLTMADADSGIDVSSLVCTDTLGGTTVSATSASAGTLSVTGQGSHSIQCKVKDLAGLWSLPATATVKIDTFAPVIARDPSEDSCTVPGNLGWCRGVQKAGFTAHDLTPGSGLVGPSTFSRTVTGNATAVSSGQVYDEAGNHASLDASPFKVDSIAPTCTPTLPIVHVASSPSWVDVTVSILGNDTPGSGVATLILATGGPNPVDIGPGANSNQWNNAPLDLVGRVKALLGSAYKFVYTVTDVAGNTGTCDATLVVQP